MFGCFTADLHALANWLECCGIKTVALESTGVYWIALDHTSARTLALLSFR
jgi:transposase